MGFESGLASSQGYLNVPPVYGLTPVNINHPRAEIHCLLVIMKFLSIPILFSFPASTLAYVNGRCYGRWNDGFCICMDYDLCTHTYKGTPYDGSPGDYPCPYDPNNIIGCFIAPCPGQGGYTECTFAEGCEKAGGEPLSGKFLRLIKSIEDPRSRYLYNVLAPVCPGGDNFFCCSQ